MSEKDEPIFQSSNNCWMCNKLFDVKDNKVRDHCQMSGEYRSSAQWSCNIILKLWKGKEIPKWTAKKANQKEFKWCWRRNTYYY